MNKTAALIGIKAGPADELAEGEFTAYASIFGNVDSYGDRVVKGAFADTLADWEKSDNVIPLLFGHNMADPDFNIGHVVHAEEDDRGLKVRGQLDLAGPKAAQVYRLLKGRRLAQLSFAYDVLEGAWVEDEDDTKTVDQEGNPVKSDGFQVYELRKLKLYEVSLVPIGANQETELLAVKAAAEHTGRFVQAVKAGRVLSAKNEGVLKEAQAQISAAAEQLAEVLAQVASTETEDEQKTHPTEPAKDPAVEAKGEQPEELKQPTEEPTPLGPVDAYLSQITLRERMVRL